MDKSCPFEIGEEVFSVVDHPSASIYILSGDHGIISEIVGSSVVGVDWCKNVGGHTCGGHCQDGFGWRVRIGEIDHCSALMPAPQESYVDDFLKDVGV